VKFRVATVELTGSESGGGAIYVPITTDAQGRALPSGFPIRAALVYASACSHSVDPGGLPSGAGTPHLVSSVGFVASNDAATVGGYSRDNQGTTVCKTIAGFGGDECSFYLPHPEETAGTGLGGNTYATAGTLYGLAQGSPQLQLFAVNGLACRITVALFYGSDEIGSNDDIPVSIGTVTTNGINGLPVGVSTRNVWSQGTPSPFTPTHVFVLKGNADFRTDLLSEQVYNSSFDGMTNGFSLSYGVAAEDEHGSNINRGLIWADAHGVGTTTTADLLSHDYAMFHSITGAGATAGPVSINIRRNGFKATQGAAATAYTFSYLALDLGKHTSEALWTYTTEAGTGNTNLLIPVEGGGADSVPGRRLNPDGIFTMQTQIPFNQIGNPQTTNPSNTFGFGVASDTKDTIPLVQSIGDGFLTFYTTFVSPYAAFTLLSSEPIFANYIFSTGDIVSITSKSSGSGDVTMGRYAVASKTDDYSIVLASNIASTTGPTYQVQGELFMNGFGLAKAQRSHSWQSRDNVGTSDTQTSVYDEVGYLLKLAGGATTYPNTTVTRFEWQDHVTRFGSSPSDAELENDAVFYYHSSKVNSRQWPMLAFEFRRQRIGIPATASSATIPAPDVQNPVFQRTWQKAILVGCELGSKHAKYHLLTQKQKMHAISASAAAITYQHYNQSYEPTQAVSFIARLLVPQDINQFYDVSEILAPSAAVVNPTVTATKQWITRSAASTVAAAQPSAAVTATKWFEYPDGLDFASAVNAPTILMLTQWFNSAGAIAVTSRLVAPTIPNYGPVNATALSARSIPVAPQTYNRSIQPAAMGVACSPRTPTLLAKSTGLDPAAVVVRAQTYTPTFVLSLQQRTPAAVSMRAMTYAATHNMLQQSRTLSAMTMRAQVTDGNTIADSAAITAAALPVSMVVNSITYNTLGQNYLAKSLASIAQVPALKFYTHQAPMQNMVAMPVVASSVPEAGSATTLADQSSASFTGFPVTTAAKVSAAASESLNTAISTLQAL
jgi:hypothetical protein